MWHSEINNRPDMPLRFIQMWFIPSEKDLAPSVEQKAVEKKERTNRLFPLVSNDQRMHSPSILMRGCIPAFFKKGIVRSFL